jgi:flavin reductase (DIM6/NTAB) family NADH-FMN oxidoreductase RutF
MTARLSAHEFRNACARFATGVCVLTTCSREGPHGLTVNSFSSLSLDPPLVMVAVSLASAQLSGFESSDCFAVNVLTEEQRSISTRFAQRDEGRFTGFRWTPGLSGAPVFDGVLAVIECQTVNRFDAGDHRVLVGEAIAASVHEGRPLLYYSSGYTGLKG